MNGSYPGPQEIKRYRPQPQVCPAPQPMPDHCTLLPLPGMSPWQSL